VEKSEVVAAEIVRVADCGPGLFTGFHEENRAALTNELLEEALCLAVEKLLVIATSTFLSVGVDPKTPTFSPKMPALSRALLLENEERRETYTNDYRKLVELLINAGADPNYETVAADLSFAMCDNPSYDVEIIEALLSGGLDTERYGPGALCSAIIWRNTSILAALIETGVSPNSYVQEGEDWGDYITPLQLAASCGNIDYIEYFLQHGGISICQPGASMA
jgi:hypothetical protein